MADFVVEVYVPRTDAVAVRLGESRARRAAQELTREGVPVKLAHSIFVPEDEVCFYLYRAESAAAARMAAERSELKVERVSLALLDGEPGRLQRRLGK